MKVQEGFHRFIIKMQFGDGSFENRHTKHWVPKELDMYLVHQMLYDRFTEMHEDDCVITDIVYRGEVEYKYDDWEIGI